MRTTTKTQLSHFECIARHEVPARFPQSDLGRVKEIQTLEIGEEQFVIEGVKLSGNIGEHLQRFNDKTNYKHANHNALYIIGNDKKKMHDIVKKTAADDVQVIGLAPNIAHTAYTVHVKSKSIKNTNTFAVDCDLLARGLVLKDDGKPELYSVQSLKSVNLSPIAQPRGWVKPHKHELKLKRAVENIGGSFFRLSMLPTRNEKLSFYGICGLLSPYLRDQGNIHLEKQQRKASRLFHKNPALYCSKCFSAWLNPRNIFKILELASDKKRPKNRQKGSFFLE